MVASRLKAVLRSLQVKEQKRQGEHIRQPLAALGPALASRFEESQVPGVEYEQLDRLHDAEKNQN